MTIGLGNEQVQRMGTQLWRRQRTRCVNFFYRITLSPSYPSSFRHHLPFPFMFSFFFVSRRELASVQLHLMENALMLIKYASTGMLPGLLRHTNDQWQRGSSQVPHRIPNLPLTSWCVVLHTLPDSDTFPTHHCLATQASRPQRQGGRAQTGYIHIHTAVGHVHAPRATVSGHRSSSPLTPYYPPT